MATKKPGTAVVPWKEEMAAAARKAAAAEKNSGGGSILQKVGVQGGVLTVDDQPVPGNALDVIVLQTTHHNAYYAGAYNPRVKSIPVCYSYGERDSEDPEAGMAPHPESKEPQDEGQGCEACWANQMGSADTGRGKACKNIRQLALVTADAADSAEAMEAAEVRTLSLPVTSVKYWANFVKKTAEDLTLPYWGVVVRVTAMPDPKTQFAVKFAFVSVVDFDADAGLYEALKAKMDPLYDEMTQPYKEPTEEAAPQARAAPARKTIPIKQAAAPAKKAAPPAAKQPAGKTATPAAKKAGGKY